jgi:hypothetical protein
MRRILCAAVLAVAVTGPTASAHHSYSSYDTSQILEVEGVLEQLDWIAPHSLFRVRSDEGRLYLGEWRAPFAMERMGFTKDTLHVGDRIVLAGNPKRDFDVSGVMNLKSVRRPADGAKWPSS